MNPITILDGLLEDYASPRTRRLIHAAIALAVTLFSIWQAVEGNWVEFVSALAVALYAGANKANTAPIPEQPVDPDEHAAWEAEPTHVDDIVPRTVAHDESELYGDGADRGTRDQA